MYLTFNVKHVAFYFKIKISLIKDDHSRVILKTPSSDKSDYIHANYIEVSI